MRSYLDAAHIRTLVADTDLRTLSGEAVTPFFEIVQASPWMGTALNWEALQPHHCVSLQTPGAIQTLSALTETVTKALVLVYSEREAIVGEVTSILVHLDDLVWGAPGRKHFVGASTGNYGIVPVPGVILEYDGADEIRLFRNRAW